MIAAHMARIEELRGVNASLVADAELEQRLDRLMRFVPTHTAGVNPQKIIGKTRSISSSS